MRILALARDIRRRRARERQGLFAIEGIRAVEELLSSPLRIRGALVSEQLAAAPRGRALRDALHARGVEVAEVGEREFATASDTDSPQGILAIADVPARSLDTIPDAAVMRLVLLDAIQDPGNVGTIVRTAAALGAVATVALGGTVDLWNAKVVRSAMGAHFHHLALSSPLDDVAAFLRHRGIPLWAADARGAAVGGLDRPGRLALAVGNEGAGLSPEVRGRADQIVSLPITGHVESLNVAVVTGILLYELQR